MTQAAQKAKYGSVSEITKADWVQEVNKAGDGVWVVLHVYKQGYVNLNVLLQEAGQRIAFKHLDYTVDFHAPSQEHLDDFLVSEFLCALS